MSEKKPPADHVENPGRKPSWDDEQMEEAIDRYFEVGNFNRAAKEKDVPVSTLFYKVKTDPRYGEEKKEVEPKDKVEPQPPLPEETGLTLDQLINAAGLGMAAFGGYKFGSYLWDKLFGFQETVETSGTGREKLKSASTFLRNLVGNLRRITGLTDPFAEGIGPFRVAVSLADTLGISREKIDRNLLRDIAEDWKDPGPLKRKINISDYRTVPPREVPPDRKERLEEFAARKDQLIKAYLKDEKEGWAILTSSGKVLRYFPPGLDSAEEWMKALGWD